MKTVRIADGVVAEVLPDYALPAEEWYGAEFASQCVEAPDDVTEGMVYDASAGTFKKPTTTQQQIEALKEKLSASDYKVIKFAEYSLAGLLAPYDIVALNAERQAIRDQINEFEARM